MTYGNVKESIIWASVVALSLSSTVYIAKSLKQVRRHFKLSKILEVFTLLIYTGLMVYFTITSFTHYFHVLNNKSDISSKLVHSIYQAELMFDQYEAKVNNRLKNYRGQLEAIVIGKVVDMSLYSTVFGTDPTPSDSDKIVIKMNNMHKDLLPEQYSNTLTGKGIKEDAITWLAKSKQDVGSWKSIGILTVAKEVEKRARGWKEVLQSFYKKTPVGEGAYDPFDPPLQFDDVKSYFEETGKPSLTALVLAFVAYLLMLSSWLIAKRDYRSRSAIAPYEIVL